MPILGVAWFLITLDSKVPNFEISICVTLFVSFAFCTSSGDPPLSQIEMLLSSIWSFPTDDSFRWEFPYFQFGGFKSELGSFKTMFGCWSFWYKFKEVNKWIKTIRYRSVLTFRLFFASFQLPDLSRFIQILRLTPNRSPKYIGVSIEFYSWLHSGCRLEIMPTKDYAT